MAVCPFLCVVNLKKTPIKTWLTCSLTFRHYWREKWKCLIMLSLLPYHFWETIFLLLCLSPLRPLTSLCFVYPHGLYFIFLPKVGCCIYTSIVIVCPCLPATLSPGDFAASIEHSISSPTFRQGTVSLILAALSNALIVGIPKPRTVWLSKGNPGVCVSINNICCTGTIIALL